METFQITIMPYFVKNVKSSLFKPTLEEIDTFMMSNINPNDSNSPKQYEDIISSVYDYSIYGEYTSPPHNIQYIPGGFITFRIGNEVTFTEVKRINGEVFETQHMELLTKEQILQELMIAALEDGPYEGVTFVYMIEDKEMGVFDFRKTSAIRIVKV
jgi:hypothetical protein